MAVIQAGLDGLLEDALNRETIGDEAEDDSEEQ